MYEDNMNTNHNSTAIPDEIDEYTSKALQVLEVVKAGRLEIQRQESERERQQKAAASDWRTRVDEAWAPHVAAAKDVLPEWMHEYLRWNNTCLPYQEDDWMMLDLPECLAIAIQPILKSDRIYGGKPKFVVPVVSIWHDEDDEWQVTTAFEYGMADQNMTLEIAVAYAHDRYGQYLEATDKAAQRNAETHAAAEAKKTATPAATSKPVQIEIPMDPAAKVLAAIAELDLDLDTVFERGLLYGLITIAAELRAIGDGINDIAAVVVANDPKSQETTSETANH